MLEMLDSNIGRVVIPFLDVTTTVFIIKTEGYSAVIDTATYPTDADDYIIPALKEAGIDKPDMIILTHSHRDHAGGLERLHEVYPEAVIVSGSAKLCEQYADARCVIPADGDILFGVLQIIYMPGHASDSLGVLDTRTKTLVTGDSLQLYGLFGSGNWGANIRNQKEHLKMLERLRCADIQTVFASHDYHTLGWRADGREAVLAYIDECVKALDDILNFLGAYQQMADDVIAEMYNASSGKPKVSVGVFTAARERL